MVQTNNQKSFGICLICKNYISDVGSFLSQFFEKSEQLESETAEINFVYPRTDLAVKLIPGEYEQDLTQNAILEIYCDSFEEFRELAEVHDVDIFKQEENIGLLGEADSISYIDIAGPENICRIVVKYKEDFESSIV